MAYPCNDAVDLPLTSGDEIDHGQTWSDNLDLLRTKASHGTLVLMLVLALVLLPVLLVPVLVPLHCRVAF